MFETIVCADIGSETTRLASGRGFAEEPTRVALDPAERMRVLAVGEPASRLLGAAEVYPVRGGVAELKLTALMLRRMVLRFLKRRSLYGVQVLAAAPGEGTPAANAALREACAERAFVPWGWRTLLWRGLWERASTRTRNARSWWRT